MRFPYSTIFTFGIFFLSLLILRGKIDKKDPTEDGNKSLKNTYSLTVDRGAFHYDGFVLANDTIRYIPKQNASQSQENALYNTPTVKVLDSLVVAKFFDKIETDGFWDLKDRYECSTTCTSELRVTLETEERTKTVICQDYERDCPEIIKYIDQKVAELEGNRLIRIYIPG